MRNPYKKFEDTDYWLAISQGINDLQNNSDLVLNTKAEYVVGYLCQLIIENITTTIDGAKLIKYTERSDFGIAELENGHKEIITRLAICKYEGGKGVYLFACDDMFSVLGDMDYETIEMAEESAKITYNIKDINWIDKVN